MVKRVLTERRTFVAIAVLFLIAALILLGVSVDVMFRQNREFDQSFRIDRDGYLVGQEFIPNTLRNSFTLGLLMNFSIAFFILSILTIILCFLIPLPEEKAAPPQTSETTN